MSLRGLVAALDGLHGGEHETLEELLSFPIEIVVLNGDRGLARKRAHKTLVVLVEREYFARKALPGLEHSVSGHLFVDQLKNADAIAFLILHRDDEHRDGAITGRFVEATIVNERFVCRRRVGIFQVQRLARLRHVTRDAVGADRQDFFFEAKLARVILGQPKF